VFNQRDCCLMNCPAGGRLLDPLTTRCLVRFFSPEDKGFGRISLKFLPLGLWFQTQLFARLGFAFFLRRLFSRFAGPDVGPRSVSVVLGSRTINHSVFARYATEIDRLCLTQTKALLRDARHLRRSLNPPPYSLLFDLALAFFCLGALLISRT